MIRSIVTSVLVAASISLCAQTEVRSMPRTLIQGSTMYPRLIRIAHGSAETNGHIMANTNRTIFRSTDDGNTWEKRSEVTAIKGSRERCCAALWELPQDVGALKAGTLLFSGTFDEGASAAIQVYTSTDEGSTWKYHSTVVKRGWAPHHGLWEPEFLIARDGSLVIFWSDETDDCCSQKLTQMRSTDGVTWKDETDTVKSIEQADRPGMAVVSKLPDGKYFMSYEICGPAYHCAVFSRMSEDGWKWGYNANMGTRIVSITGQTLAHAPNNHYMPNGHIYLAGQMVLDANGKVSKDNGKVLFVSNPQNPLKPWTTTPAPVPVPAAYNDPCPNYSSAMLPTSGGKSFIEIASDFNEGHRCSVFEGILPLPPQ